MVLPQTNPSLLGDPPPRVGGPLSPGFLGVGRLRVLPFLALGVGEHPLEGGRLCLFP